MDTAGNQDPSQRLPDLLGPYRGGRHHAAGHRGQRPGPARHGHHVAPSPPPARPPTTSRSTRCGSASTTAGPASGCRPTARGPRRTPSATPTVATPGAAASAWSLPLTLATGSYAPGHQGARRSPATSPPAACGTRSRSAPRRPTRTPPSTVVALAGQEQRGECGLGADRPAPAPTTWRSTRCGSRSSTGSTASTGGSSPTAPSDRRTPTRWPPSRPRARRRPRGACRSTCRPASTGWTPRRSTRSATSTRRHRGRRSRSATTAAPPVAKVTSTSTKGSARATRSSGNQLVDVAGTAKDDSSVMMVEASPSSSSVPPGGKRYLQKNGSWGRKATLLRTDVAKPGSSHVTWKLRLKLPAARYQVKVVPVDASRNKATRPATKQLQGEYSEVMPPTSRPTLARDGGRTLVGAVVSNACNVLVVLVIARALGVGAVGAVHARLRRPRDPAAGVRARDAHGDDPVRGRAPGARRPGRRARRGGPRASWRPVGFSVGGRGGLVRPGRARWRVGVRRSRPGRRRCGSSRPACPSSCSSTPPWPRPRGSPTCAPTRGSARCSSPGCGCCSPRGCSCSAAVVVAASCWRRSSPACWPAARGRRPACGCSVGCRRAPLTYPARELASFGATSWVASMATQGLLWADVVILGVLVTNEEVGAYQVAARVVLIAMFVITSLPRPMAPRIASSWERGDVARHHRQLRRGGAVERAARPGRCWPGSWPYPTAVLHIFGSDFGDATSVVAAARGRSGRRGAGCPVVGAAQPDRPQPAQHGHQRVGARLQHRSQPGPRAALRHRGCGLASGR